MSNFENKSNWNVEKTNGRIRVSGYSRGGSIESSHDVSSNPESTEDLLLELKQDYERPAVIKNLIFDRMSKKGIIVPAKFLDWTSELYLRGYQSGTLDIRPQIRNPRAKEAYQDIYKDICEQLLKKEVSQAVSRVFRSNGSYASIASILISNMRNGVPEISAGDRDTQNDNSFSLGKYLGTSSEIIDGESASAEKIRKLNALYEKIIDDNPYATSLFSGVFENAEQREVDQYILQQREFDNNGPNLPYGGIVFAFINQIKNGLIPTKWDSINQVLSQHDFEEISPDSSQYDIYKGLNRYCKLAGVTGANVRSKILSGELLR